MDLSTPCLRLCLVQEKPSFPGYGFNLYSEKGKSGHFIGNVDVNSPAWEAGLRNDDRIVEVNGININNENHKQVVERIKMRKYNCKMLLANKEADDYIKNNGPNNICVLDLTSLGKEIKPRICHLEKVENYEGYGFTVITEKDNITPVVSDVDKNSPAYIGGLKVEDQILKINEKILSPNLLHSEIVEMIGQHDSFVDLLVVNQSKFEEFHRLLLHNKLNQSMIQTAQDSKKTYQDLNDVYLKQCHVVSSEKQLGFGFNLVGENDKPGNYVDRLEKDSPAWKAGLKDEDYLVTVNNDLVLSRSHYKVVQKIKEVPTEVKMVVTNQEGFKKLITFPEEEVEKLISSRFFSTPSIPLYDFQEQNGTLKKINSTKESNEDDNSLLDYRKVTEEIVQIATREADIAKESIDKVKRPPSPPKPALHPERMMEKSLSYNGIEFARSIDEVKKKMRKKKNFQNTMSLQDKYDLFQSL